MPKSFTFNTFNKNSSYNVKQSIIECNPKNFKPVFVCIGSDLVLGDSLGPLVGTFLRNKNLSSYIYGTLNFPITAKEISYIKSYINNREL